MKKKSIMEGAAAFFAIVGVAWLITLAIMQFAFGDVTRSEVILCAVGVGILWSLSAIFGTTNWEALDEPGL